MKKILVTQRIDPATGYREDRGGLDILWGKLFSKIGLLPIALPFHVDVLQFVKAADIDGVLFSGGNDLNHLQPSTVGALRDETERQLLEICLEYSIPTFAVCRGMQFIGHHFGADLEKVEGHVATTHSLAHLQSSVWCPSLAQLNDVNTYHGYRLAQAPADFDVLATSNDGTIEAMEHPTKRIFCQMWHPERTLGYSAINEKILTEFFL